MKLYKKAGNLNQIKGYATCSVCANYADKCHTYCVSENGRYTESYKNDWLFTSKSFNSGK